MTDEEKRAWLEQNFPWLTDPDQHVSGTDVIDTLARLYEEVTTGG